MRISAFLVSLIFCFAQCKQNSQPSEAYYVASDFTKENLFTENIEGPNFDRNGNLYVVNFQKNGTIGLVHPDGSVELFVTLPEGSTANAIQFDASGNMLLADWTAHNILKVDMSSKNVSVYSHSDSFHQPNDICINKKGQLFASDPDWANGTGQLWRIDSDGTPILLTNEMGTANGIELSPDEKTLYVNESKQRKIWSFKVADDGSISGKQLLHEFPDFEMDGMKCDRDGNIYVTRHGKGTVAILSPDGKLIREVSLKGKKVSNIVFGGADGKTCFVTLQDRKGMEMFRSEIPGKKFGSN